MKFFHLIRLQVQSLIYKRFAFAVQAILNH